MPRRFNPPSSALPRLRPMAVALSLAMGTAHGADEAPKAADILPVITISGSADNADNPRLSASASKLNLSVLDTPQSVSLVTRSRMDDFQLDNVNAVLANSTGVTVEQVETDRSYYVARGFDIINLQNDGVGAPLVFGIAMGELDTAIYDRVDIVRGANGLSSATGNPSATVNFLRKRPTAKLQASAALTLGSWNKRRLEADLSAPLNSSGTVRGRAVVASQDSDAYLDRYSTRRNLGYGVIEAALGQDTLLTVGHVQQEGVSRGGFWGALPLYYTDGSPTSYPGNTNTSADWSRWEITKQSSFIELTHGLANGWELKSTFSRLGEASDSTLFYVYGTPDKATGAGLFSYPSKYRAKTRQYLLDVQASGQFGLAGRRHELSVGASGSDSKIDELSLYGRGIGTPLDASTDFTGAYPEPLFDASTNDSKYEDKRKSVYAAARFDVAERLKVLAGLNTTWAKASGHAYGSSQRKDAQETSPYAGAVYTVAPGVTGYASYTGIFNPQSETDINGQTLAPVKGSSAEAGVKAELLQRKLMLSAAVFRARQNNTAEQAGIEGGKAYYRGIDAESRGVELEAGGALSPGWQVNAGLTRLKLESPDGKAVRTYVPRTLLRMATTYQLPALPQLKIGASLNWQGDTERDQGEGIVTRQQSYAVLGLMARYAFNEQLSLAVNVNNVGDKRYLTSLYWSQAYYAAPRNASATLAWHF